MKLLSGPERYGVICAFGVTLMAWKPFAAAGKLDRDDVVRQVMMRAARFEIDIDARPSDAIALAVRAEVPILVADDVLDKAGVTPEGESESSEEPSAESTIFKELVNSMDLPDLEGPPPEKS